MQSLFDPNLPNYVHDDLRAFEKELKVVFDAWNDLRDGFKDYIFKEREEPIDEYEKRLKSTVFDNLFKPAIKSYSGLLSRFKLLDATPKSIVQAIDNVDGRGNSLEVFLQDADDNVLRDGATAFIVDFPDTSELNIVTPLDLTRSGVRPFFALINRRDLINFDFDIEQGVHRLSFAIIRSERQERDGLYGRKTTEIFREFRRGDESSNFQCYYMEWEISEDKKKKKVAIQLGETRYYSSREIPIVIYSATDRDPLATLPPFLNTAMLNIQMLRKQCQLDEVLRKINFPVPVREGAAMVASPSAPGGFAYPALTTGSNHVVDLPIGGKFYFSEPTGAAIAATQEDIKNLRLAIDRVSLAFLGGQRSGSMTATEALLNTAQVTTTINGIARRKESVVQELFALWCSYTGEAIGEDAGIAIDDSIIKPPMTEVGEQVVYQALNDRIISPTVGYLKLKEGGALPEGISIEEEIAWFEKNNGGLNGAYSEGAIVANV
ncbi:MAG: DUF4055 domain-containing protein [Microcoleus sp.]